ncbi:DUF3261 domain-containing protein [Shewanella sp. YIC-542]|uniref:DUF3261 domain-containing protein n=1 Tax=Shewanella mytili TaxID=3377111 RepID=UPI00398EC63D
MRSLIWCLLLWCCTGCQHTQNLSQSCVTLTAGVDYCLTPLPWQQGRAAQPDDMAQQVRFSQHQQTRELLLQLQFSPDSELMVGLAPLGQPLFTLHYDGHTLASQHSGFMAGTFRGDYLLAVQQLIYWPAAMVQQGLASATVKDFRCGMQHCREIRRGDALIARIHYAETPGWQSPVTLELPQAAVQLSITPM